MPLFINPFHRRHFDMLLQKSRSETNNVDISFTVAAVRTTATSLILYTMPAKALQLYCNPYQHPARINSLLQSLYILIQNQKYFTAEIRVVKWISCMDFYPDLSVICTFLCLCVGGAAWLWPGQPETKSKREGGEERKGVLRKGKRALGEIMRAMSSWQK